jgi:replicative DNA helicase
VVRAICAESRVNFHRVKTSDVGRMILAVGQISKAPIYIERASGFSVGQIKAVARRLHKKHNIQLIAIDYLQMLSGTGDNKEQEVSSISKGVKSLAMELDIPILLLSQVNKDGETKYAKAATEDTDSLWKLENEGDWNPSVQPIKLTVEKCRDGATGTIGLTFLKEFTKFESAARVSDKDVPGEK